MRRRFGNLQLGPPLRAVHDEEDEEVDGCGIAEPNKENAKTPVTCVTIPGGTDSHWSAKKGGLPLQTKLGTPSSTCPNFWNPGNPAKGGQRTEEPQTDASVGKLLREAPRAFPAYHECSPRLPSGRKPIKQQESISRRSPFCAGLRATTAVVNGSYDEPGCKGIPRDCVPSSDHKLSPSKTAAVHPIPRHTSAKPPIDHASARMNCRTAPHPVQVLFASPEKQDVVIMTSPTGEERRFQKLTLVGCGGSSKVCLLGR